MLTTAKTGWSVVVPFSFVGKTWPRSGPWLFSPNTKAEAFGRALAKTVISEAESFKTRKIFTLTYEPEFFKKFGFKEIDRAELPLKIWADCIICVKFPDCDETAMMKDLGPTRE